MGIEIIGFVAVVLLAYLVPKVVNNERVSYFLVVGKREKGKVYQTLEERT